MMCTSDKIEGLWGRRNDIYRHTADTLLDPNNGCLLSRQRVVSNRVATHEERYCALDLSAESRGKKICLRGVPLQSSPYVYVYHPSRSDVAAKDQTSRGPSQHGLPRLRRHAADVSHDSTCHCVGKCWAGGFCRVCHEMPAAYRP